MVAYTAVLLLKNPAPIIAQNDPAGVNKLWDTQNFTMYFLNVTAADVPTGKAAALAAYQTAWMATEQARYTGTDPQNPTPGGVPVIFAEQAPDPILIKLLIGTVSEAPGD